jgi:hypothetical protein
MRPFFTEEEWINSSLSEPKTLFLKQVTPKYYVSFIIHFQNNDWHFGTLE